MTQLDPRHPVRPHENLAQVRHIETLARHAWPAREQEELGGWLLRHTDGVTRRANSVWPNEFAHAAELDDRLVHVESFYAARNQPACYQICPAALPVALDDVLARRGYVAVAETAVQTVPLAELTQRVATRAGRQGAAGTVHVTTALSHRWYDAYCESEGVAGHDAEVRRAIIARITAPVGYAVAVRAGRVVALGMGVLADGWLGIFNMATLPAYRRQGLALAVLGGLAQWAVGAGAHNSYLQVMLANPGAQALYAQLGYRTLYHYHYRLRRAD